MYKKFICRYKTYVYWYKQTDFKNKEKLDNWKWVEKLYISDV